MSNYCIRPIAHSDLADVAKLATLTGIGMTSLTDDPVLLEKKIQNSINSFMITPTQIGNELYLLVLEDLDSKTIVGTAAIRARVGGFQPFYSYQIKQAKHDSESLNVHKEVAYLELCKEHNGPSILSSLFLHPDHRKGSLGRQLSLSRLLFIAENRNRFTDTLIAEMRGYIENGKSPFWENVVKPFFDMEFSEADHLSAQDKGFIADLMPRYPIYIPLLKNEVINCIGKVHKETEGALQFLLEEGFKKDSHVDIFDAGPRIAAKINDLATIKNSQHSKITNITDKLDVSEHHLIANCKIDFRASYQPIAITKDGITINKATAQILNLEQGDGVRFL